MKIKDKNYTEGSEKMTQQHENPLDDLAFWLHIAMVDFTLGLFDIDSTNADEHEGPFG